MSRPVSIKIIADFTRGPRIKGNDGVAFLCLSDSARACNGRFSRERLKFRQTKPITTRRDAVGK